MFYRASVARVAKANDVTGYAHNLPDGRVEVLLCGAEDAVERVVAALWEGSRVSKVESVDVEPVSIDPPVSFTTG